MYWQNVYLKQLVSSDLDDRVMSWFDDEELMRYYTNSRNKITRESLSKSIEQGAKDNNLFTFGIYLPSNLIIGTVKLGIINHVDKTSDMATLIGDRNYLGKGLSSEAVSLGTKLAFERFDLRKLITGMYAINVPSIKAYLKAGWIVEGLLKGYYFVDGKNVDRVLAGSFNPKYFSQEEINSVKSLHQAISQSF